MSHTQFSMVEELAFLVKDNLPCKHLVLSMEDMLVRFLHTPKSLNEVLELEPMNPYYRLLLHRLADIFGFCHESVGEGDDRHLVLKRCEDTSIPSILVADLLWEDDGYQSPLTSHLLTRQEDDSTDPMRITGWGITSSGVYLLAMFALFFTCIASEILTTESTLPNFDKGTAGEPLTARVSLEDREAAYLAARKRIFSTENDDKESRPRNNPVVAQRMIAHALGQRIKQSNGVKPVFIGQKSNGQQKQPLTRKNFDTEASTNAGTKKGDTNVPNHKHEEHIGAAKRMFANALRMHPSKTNKS